jgi:hypothetical protein
LLAVCSAGVAALDRGANAKAPAARTLLLTQRFTPVAAPPSNPLARSLVALRGETEGFQLVVRSPGGRLRAGFSSGTPALIARHGRILRVGFVRVRRPSSGVGRRGVFADPLPPQVPSGMPTDARRFAGFAVLVDVPRDARPGAYEAGVVVTNEGGRPAFTPWRPPTRALSGSRAASRTTGTNGSRRCRAARRTHSASASSGRF